jgi:hypothetical protein
VRAGQTTLNDFKAVWCLQELTAPEYAPVSARHKTKPAWHAHAITATEVLLAVTAVTHRRDPGYSKLTRKILFRMVKQFNRRFASWSLRRQAMLLRERCIQVFSLAYDEQYGVVLGARDKLDSSLLAQLMPSHWASRRMVIIGHQFVNAD